LLKIIRAIEKTRNTLSASRTEVREYEKWMKIIAYNRGEEFTGKYGLIQEE